MAKKVDKEKKEIIHTSNVSVLDMALKAVIKKHGQVIKWLSETPDDKIDFISTGSLSLDYALGGGFPRGRITEIFGWESSGKSTLALTVAAEANRRGLSCLYIDAERALDRTLPVSYGVNPSMFILEDQPITAEEHFTIVDDLVRSGEVGVVVIDSVSSLVPKAIMEGKVGDSYIGVLARFLSQECPKLIHSIGDTNTLFIFINQYREKVMRMPGDPRTTSGGNALRFYSSVRVEVSGTGKTKSGAILDEKGEVIGHRMNFKVMKNKVGIPYRKGGIDLVYGKGYDVVGELIELAADLGVIDRGGAWYSYPEMDIKIQGAAAFREIVLQNKELHSKLQNQVTKILGLSNRPIA